MINMIYLAVYFLILASYGIGMSKSNRDVYGYGKIVRDGTNREVVAIAGKNLLKERLYERSKRTNVEAERRDQRALAREKKKEEQEQVAALNNVEAERRDQRALAREKKKEEQETLRRGGKDSENVEDFIDSMNGGGSLRGRFHLSGDGFEFDFRGAVVGDLFKYQVDGVKWLFKLHCQGHGGILADDMGLGKTRQVCVFLKGLFNTSSIERVLILAPPGLLGNWETELELVDLKWQKYRKLAAGDKASKGISLVSMVLLEKPDNEFFQGDFPFCKVIIDEGHVLKNPETKKASNVLNIRVKDDGFIIMSGTPIQNNLMEFYELLNLCHQKHFGDLKWFSSHYEELTKYGVYRGLDQHVDTSVKEKVEELKTSICSYYLRREKETTLALPPKHELVIWLKLSQKQRNMYLAFLKLRETNTDEFPNVLSACERLQSLCSDPTLWYLEKPLTLLDKRLNKILCEAEASSDRESESVKLVFLSELLPDIIKQKECVLIFSQYLGMLDAVELLVKPKYKFLRLDGNTDPKKRDEIIKEFQFGDFPIFLLSYKVGALGYNLTKATRVILLDLSWNPTTDDQAVDRAYRLKQTKSVLVYRLVCCGTIEERKYRNQILKNTLRRMIFGKKEPLRIFREKDIDKTYDVQEKDFNSSAIKRIIDTQLMKTGQDKMPSSLEQYVDSLMSKDYIHGVSSHSLIVSAVDRLKSRSRSRSKSPGHRLERPGLDDSVGRAQVASFDHRIPESCRSGTIPCKFFAPGNCRNGKTCRFSHDSDLNLPKGHGNKNEGFGEQGAMRSSVDASAPRDNRFKAHRMHIDEATKKNGSDDFRLTTHSSPGMSASKSRGTAIRGASFDHRKHEPCRSGTIPCKFFASGNCRNGKACRFSHDEQTRDIFDNYEPNDYRQGVNNRANMAPLREGSKWSGSASDLNLKKGHGNKNEGLGEQRAMRSSVDASAPRDNRFMAHRMDIDEATKKNRSDDFRLTTHSSPGMSASKSRGTAIRGVDIEGTSSYTEDQLPTLIGTSGNPDVLDTVRSEAVISEQPDEIALPSQLPLTGEPSGDGPRGTRCKDPSGDCLHGADCKDVELNNNTHQSSEKHQFADCENEEHGIVKAEDKKEGQDGIKLADSEGDDKDDEKKKNSEGKSLRAFKFSLAESVKELLMPTWKAGQINKEAHKTIAKKVVDKVTSSVQAGHIPQTQEKIDNYLSANKPKLSKLVQAYVDKVQKENTKVA